MPETRPTLTTYSDDGAGAVKATSKLSPPLQETSSTGLQAILKSRIDRAKMNAFLERKLTEDSIDSMRSILDLEGDLYSSESNNYQRKRLFDMAIMALYEELLTPEKAVSIVGSLGVLGAADLFEKMAVLESGMYYLDKDLSAVTTSSSEPFYITDSISSIYYADPTKDSYQSLENVEEELQTIYDDTLDGGSLPTEITNLLTGFDYKSLARINGRRAAAEGENIAKYKFLLNYTSTSTALDRSLIRKYWAVSGYGYYIRDGKRIYLTGLTTGTGGAENYSYYSLLESTYNSGYKAAHDFLISFWENISGRTIHY